jgi:lysozyme
MGRKRAISNRWRIAAALLLVVLVGAVWGWWQFAHWTPSRASWPVQGIEIGADDVAGPGDPVDFTAFKAIGADFAYLDASRGADERDPAFSDNLAAVRAAGIRFGAVHAYDPCIPAEKQAANFFTVVPRDPSLLPPAIELDKTADDCLANISDAGVESELTTFINQIQNHTGKKPLLKISQAFEQRYRLAARVEHDLWVSGDWFQPSYAGRPWTLWTANSALRSEASGIPVRWIAAQP